MAAEPKERILLGRIAGAHGIRGEVLVHSYTDAPEKIGAYGALSDPAGARQFKVKVVRVTPRGVIARIAGVADRNAAEPLKGIELYVERARLPSAGEGEYYHADLIGLQAVDTQGHSIGRVAAVQNFGAGDLLEIRLAGSSKTELIPFDDAHVPEVDLVARRAIVKFPAYSDDGGGEDDPAREA
jgi:16S rRNA processing protein RimM